MDLDERIHDDRFCPLVRREISADTCYEIVMCFTSGFNIASVPEVSIEKNPDTKRICDNCPYSDLS